MTGGLQVAMLPDGLRLHLHHGPIDLIIEAFSAPTEVRRAYRQAVGRFGDILSTLVEELAELRRPVTLAYPLFRGPVARRMAAAVWPHRERFITPMAAVAGAVADEVLAALVTDRDLKRAYVNNGGDIALFLSPGERFRSGVVSNQNAPALDAVAAIDAAVPVRGIATSGWRGRSFSIGIADSVTVLARDAAQADAAATLIANAVDVDHPAVVRRPASDLADDTDLGDRLVTVDVGRLPADAAEDALAAGTREARAMRQSGLIGGAIVALQGHFRVVGRPADALSWGQSQCLGGRGWT